MLCIKGLIASMSCGPLTSETDSVSIKKTYNNRENDGKKKFSNVKRLDLWGEPLILGQGDKINVKSNIVKLYIFLLFLSFANHTYNNC